MWVRRMVPVVLVGLLLSGVSLGHGLAMADEPVPVNPEPVAPKPAEQTRRPAKRSPAPTISAWPLSNPAFLRLSFSTLEKPQIDSIN